MNKLLINYIRQYLKEATIPYPAKDISAKLQSELSPNVAKDMTHIKNPKEILKILMKNLGDKTCISFVNSHDDKGSVPNFSINPHAQYETPHGNYAYPLKLENLRELIRTKKVHGASFAVDRPYFLLFKIKSPDVLVINKDGTSNYNEVMSNKRGSSRRNIDQDIDRVLKSFVYFLMTGIRVDKNNPFATMEDFNQQSFNTEFNMVKGSIRSGLAEISGGTHAGALNDFIRKVSPDINFFLERSVAEINDFPKSAEKEILDYFKSYFKKRVLELSESNHNKFFKKDGRMDNFHKIYFICWFLSNFAKNILYKKSNGPILTLFLKEVGIDGIIDHGSSTLHTSEPEQTVLLNFGNKSGKGLEFIGTFNNIFSHDSTPVDGKNPEQIDLEEIAAEVYQEEGYKFDVDYFSPEDIATIPTTQKVIKDITNASNNEHQEVIDKTLKYVSFILKTLDDKKIIRFHEDAKYEDIDSAIFEININTNISNSEMQELLKIIKEINQIANNLANTFSFDVEIVKKFVQLEDSNIFANKFLIDLYSHSDFLENFPYGDSAYHPLTMNYMKNGTLICDSNFINKVVVDTIILNYCEKEFVIEVDNPEIFGYLLYDNILKINGGNPTINVSKINNKIKIKSDEQEMKIFEKMCNDLKNKFTNINLEK